MIPERQTIDDTGTDTDLDSEAIQNRERAKYLRRMAEATPNRPDRDRLLELAAQYEKLAASA